MNREYHFLKLNKFKQESKKLEKKDIEYLEIGAWLLEQVVRLVVAATDVTITTAKEEEEEREKKKKKKGGQRGS